MAGLSHLAHINEALRECGLLAFDDAGGIDWSRTRIFYHPANNGSLWIHPRALSGGIASSEVGRQVLISAADALRRLRDQETGRPVIEAIYPFDGTTEAGWSPALGDLFLAAADGVDFSAERSPDGQTVVATRKTASHMTNTRRQSLAGIFFACGPAIRPIGDLGEIDNRDVFPFLCEQMRLPRPERIEGRVPASLRV
jgi:predicted AlkP superfamily phosphohydrolase/phosphomutase